MRQVDYKAQINISYIVVAIIREAVELTNPTGCILQCKVNIAEIT